MRNILHDWPDDVALKILEQLKPALTPGHSKIVINELVIPDRGTNRSAFGGRLDMNMLSICAGTERTESMWRTLISQAGLKIEKIWFEGGEEEAFIEIMGP